MKQSFLHPHCSCCRIDPYGCCEWHERGDEKLARDIKQQSTMKSRVSSIMLKIRPVFGHSINFVIATYIIYSIMGGRK